MEFIAENSEYRQIKKNPYVSPADNGDRWIWVPLVPLRVDFYSREGGGPWPAKGWAPQPRLLPYFLTQIMDAFVLPDEENKPSCANLAPVNAAFSLTCLITIDAVSFIGLMSF